MSDVRSYVPPWMAPPEGVGVVPVPNVAVTQGPDGKYEGKVVELQGFPSLYALMTLMADAWSSSLNTVPEMKAEWQHFIGMEREPALDLMRRNTYVLATGVQDQGRDQNEKFGGIMRAKGIAVRLDVWGDGTGHDWPWWQRMAQTYL